MATTYTAAAASGQRPAVTVTGAGQVTVNSGVYEIGAAIVINDVFKLCRLPAGHVPVDLNGMCDDLDSATAAVFDVGILDLDYGSGTDTSDPDAFASGLTTAQAGGVFRMTAKAALDLAPVDYDRFVTIKFTTAPGTSATTGTLRVNLLSRPAGRDD